MPHEGISTTGIHERNAGKRPKNRLNDGAGCLLSGPSRPQKKLSAAADRGILDAAKPVAGQAAAGK